MFAAHDELTLVPPAPGGGLATFVDLTLHDAFDRAPMDEDRLDKLVNRPSGGRLVVYSWHLQRTQVDRALAHGAAGCLAKSLPATELVDALMRVADGETIVRGLAVPTFPEVEGFALTPREAEVVGLIASGMSNHDIADTTGLSINSVKSYIRGAYRKMQVTTRSQAVLWALQHGCIGASTAPALPAATTEDLVPFPAPAAEPERAVDPRSAYSA